MQLYKFAFAKQQPVIAAFHAVVALDPDEPMLLASNWAEQDLLLWDHVFDLDIQTSFYSDDGARCGIPRPYPGVVP